MSYFNAKMHQIRFPPDPVLGVHKLDLKGPTSKGRGGSTGVRRKGKGFFFIFKHLWALKRSWKISRGGAEKSWIFLSVKEWEPWVNNLVLILQLLDASVLLCFSCSRTEVLENCTAVNDTVCAADPREFVTCVFIWLLGSSNHAERL